MYVTRGERIGARAAGVLLIVLLVVVSAYSPYALEPAAQSPFWPDHLALFGLGALLLLGGLVLLAIRIAQTREHSWPYRLASIPGLIAIWGGIWIDAIYPLWLPHATGLTSAILIEFVVPLSLGALTPVLLWMQGQG